MNSNWTWDTYNVRVMDFHVQMWERSAIWNILWDHNAVLSIVEFWRLIIDILDCDCSFFCCYSQRIISRNAIHNFTCLQNIITTILGEMFEFKLFLKLDPVVAVKDDFLSSLCTILHAEQLSQDFGTDNYFCLTSLQVIL